MTRSTLPAPELVWQKLTSRREKKHLLTVDWEVHRAKVPGGWLVLTRPGGSYPGGMTFYPDPDHRWTGGSLP